MNDLIQSSFIDKGIHYKIQLTIQQADTFSILLFDEDQPERWEGLFNGQSISKLTASVGNMKKVQIFFKMLQNAILGNSKEVSFTILSQRDINEMKSNSGSQTQTQSSISQINLSETRYFILEQHTEFDRVKYPLRLLCKPYSTEELKSIIRGLRSENKRLGTSEQSALQKEKVQALEQQIYELNGSIRRLAEEKDQVISNLRRQITDLEEKARLRQMSKNQSTTSNRTSKTFRTNKSNLISSNSNARNTPNTKRKSNISNRTGFTSSNRFQSNSKNSQFSSASSSAASSRKSSAASSRKSSAASSRRSSAASSRKSSAVGSARSSASNSRPSSRSSNGSFKRFNPTEWVINHQKSAGGSRNNSRNQSPANAHRPLKRVNSSGRGSAQTDAHLKRLHALVQKKYL